MDKTLRETSNLGEEIANSKRQVKRKHGHVVEIPVCSLQEEVLTREFKTDHMCNSIITTENKGTGKEKVLINLPAIMPVFRPYVPWSTILMFALVFASLVKTIALLNVNSAIQRINFYQVDNAIGFPNTYRLDSDLSGE